MKWLCLSQDARRTSRRTRFCAPQLGGTTAPFCRVVDEAQSASSKAPLEQYHGCLNPHNGCFFFNFHSVSSPKTVATGPRHKSETGGAVHRAPRSLSCWRRPFLAGRQRQARSAISGMGNEAGGRSTQPCVNTQLNDKSSWMNRSTRRPDNDEALSVSLTKGYNPPLGALLRDRKPLARLRQRETKPRSTGRDCHICRRFPRSGRAPLSAKKDDGGSRDTALLLCTFLEQTLDEELIRHPSPSPFLQLIQSFSVARFLYGDVPFCNSFFDDSFFISSMRLAFSIVN
ncbi:hypothetical protein VTK26DRAFT_9009 [Humicola hyalothermophila]